MTSEFDVYCEGFKDWLAAGAITTAAMSPFYKTAMNYNNPDEGTTPIEQQANPPKAVPWKLPKIKNSYGQNDINDNIQTINHKLNRLKGNKELLRNYINSLPINVLRELTGLNEKVPIKFLGPILYGGIIKNFNRFDIIAAVLSRETIFGSILDRNGKGDHGHGHGVMQIDDRSHRKWLSLGLWNDPYENIVYGLGEINGNLRIFNNDMFKSLAAYNTGASNVKKSLKRGKSAEATTAHHNYASDVLKRAKAFRQNSNSNIAQN